MRLFTGGLHHLSIRTTDLARAKRFYTDTMGFQPVRETDGAVLLNANGTILGLLGAAPETRPEDRFDPSGLASTTSPWPWTTRSRCTSSNSSWTQLACGTTVSRTTRSPAPGTSLSTTRMALPGSCTRCLLRPRRQS